MGYFSSSPELRKSLRSLVALYFDFRQAFPASNQLLNIQRRILVRFSKSGNSAHFEPECGQVFSRFWADRR
jgi:hypothetical protein